MVKTEFFGLLSYLSKREFKWVWNARESPFLMYVHIAYTFSIVCYDVLAYGTAYLQLWSIKS